MEKTTDILLDKAIDNVPLNERGDIPKGGVNDFLEQLGREFIVERIKDFPRLCQETREVNIAHLKQLAEVGNKSPTRMVGGKVYEGSIGWSNDMQFKHKWIIPMQLKFFMRNLIYVDFWDDDNAKVRDKFMKDVVKGEDPLETLRKVRSHFGPNPT